MLGRVQTEPQTGPQGLLMRTLLGEATDGAQVGVVVYDETGRYLAANRAICEQLGYTLDELLRLTPAALSARSERAVARALAQVVANGAHSGTARLRRKDGGVVEGRYVATRTTVAHLDYYISFFEPRRSTARS